MRLLDELRVRGFRLLDGDFDYTDWIVAINGDRVEKELATRLISGGKTLDYKTLNLAPSFNNTALEYLHDPNNGTRPYRVLCLASSLSDIDPRWPDEKFWTELKIFTDDSNLDSLEPRFQFMFWMDEHGGVINELFDKYCNEAKLQALRLAAPYFLATAILNCRNSSLVEIENPHSYERKFSKWNKIPATRYKELVITPFKGKRGKCITGESGIRQGLHISRGHFKDYRDRGLFGKIKGVYWWQAGLRGDLDHGMIDKSYVIYPK